MEWNRNICGIHLFVFGDIHSGIVYYHDENGVIVAIMIYIY